MTILFFLCLCVCTHTHTQTHTSLFFSDAWFPFTPNYFYLYYLRSRLFSYTVQWSNSGNWHWVNTIETHRSYSYFVSLYHWCFLAKKKFKNFLVQEYRLHWVVMFIFLNANIFLIQSSKDLRGYSEERLPHHYFYPLASSARGSWGDQSCVFPEIVCVYIVRHVYTLPLFLCRGSIFFTLAILFCTSFYLEDYFLLG